jgi:hypothetical protein
VRLVRAIAGAIRYRFSWATMQAKLRAIGAGLIVSLRLQAERQPVPQSVYRAYRALPHHGAEDWTSELPAPCTELRVSA